MNLTQAGFNILMMLAVSDMHIDSSETKVIQDFLEKNFRADFDFNK